MECGEPVSGSWLNFKSCCDPSAVDNQTVGKKNDFQAVASQKKANQKGTLRLVAASVVSHSETVTTLLNQAVKLFTINTVNKDEHCDLSPLKLEKCRSLSGS